MGTDPLLFARAVSDETRRRIMSHLCCGWLSVDEVVRKIGGRVSQPTVSHHLKRLREAGLVRVRREGRQRLYTLNQEQVTVCCGRLVRSFAPNRKERS